MKPAAIVCALAAVAFCATALPVFAQGRVYDRNASNNPEIYRQTHPEDAGSAQDLQGRPSPYDVREAERREQASRDQASRDAARREAERQNASRRNQDWRRAERRDDDRRRYGYGPYGGYGRYGGYGGYDGWGYVAPPAMYYSPPPAIYYNSRPTYYGNANPIPAQPGDYLPRDYLAAQYIVSDWQWRGLSAPPYGYQWVQLGNVYALVVSSTGQIASIVAIQ
ncbi:MAG: hypothetical protein NVS3B2_17870 [Ramlibacter sp.]